MAISVSGLGIYEHKVPLDENTFHSERWAEILGYQLHELPKPEKRMDWIFNRIHPEDIPVIEKAYNDFLEGRTSTYYVEIRVKHKSGNYIYINGISEAKERDENGKVLEIIGTIQDITERKQAEKKLRESEELLLEAQYIAHIAHWTFDPATGMPWWSEELYRIYGRDPADGPLPYAEHPKLVHPDDWEWFDATVRATAEEGTPFDIILRIMRPDGSVRIINSICQPLTDDTGAVVEMRGTIQDVTKLKQAEEKLIESLKREKIQADIVRNTPVAIAFGYPDGRLDNCNQAFSDLTGYSEEELKEINWSKVLTPSKWEKIEADELKKLSPENNFVKYEKEYIHKNGTIIPIELVATAKFDDNGKVVHYIGFVTDITERKQAEKALRESEERYRTVFENTGTATVILEEDSTLSLTNDEFVKLSGYSIEEIEGKKCWTEFVVKEDLQKMGEQHDLRRKDSESALKNYEFRFVDREGNVKDIFLTIGMISGTTKSVASLLDITERKQAENSLRTSEAQLSNAMEIAKLGYWEYDVDSDLFTFNDHFYDIFRTTAEKVGGYKMSPERYAKHFLHPDDRLLLGNETRKAIETTDPNFSRQLEHRIIYADGEIGYISVRFFVIKDDHGRTIKTYGANQDITERKQVQEALISRERRYRNVIQTTIDGFWSVDEHKHLIEVNDAYCRMSGYSREELLTMSIYDVEASETNQEVDSHFREVIEQGGGQFETRHKRKDGSIYNVEIICSFDPMKNQLFVFTRNITERKEIESALRESEKRFRGTFEQAAVGIGHVAPDGKWLRVNQRLCDIAGYTQEELRRLTFQDITHPGDLDADLNYENQILMGEIQTYSMEKRYIHKDGHRVWINLTVSLIRKDNGQPDYSISVIEDITTRKHAEEQLNAALEEKEVLLRELYHRTKNNMNVIQSMLTLQAAFSRNEEVERIAKEVGHKIQAMALVHQKLYQSQDLSRILLHEYLPELADLLRQSYIISPAKIALRLDVAQVFALIDTAIPCGLILNELMSNAFKHAFPDGRNGNIQIQLTEDDQGLITLQVSDNGVGVPQGFDFRTQDTLGLQSIAMIAEHQLQGTVVFTANNGVTCRIQFTDTSYQARV